MGQRPQEELVDLPGEKIADQEPHQQRAHVVQKLQHQSTYMHCVPSPVLKLLAPVDADFGYLRFLMAAQNCVSQVIGSLSDLVSSAASAKSR